MSGIAGIAKRGNTEKVTEALRSMRTRAGSGKRVFGNATATLGMTDTETSGINTVCGSTAFAVYDGLAEDAQETDTSQMIAEQLVELYEKNGPAFLNNLQGPYALAIARQDGLFLARDPMGAAPLYYGTCDDAVCFASEAEALEGWATDIRELQPGQYYLSWMGPVRFARPVNKSH